ncbi:MAG: ABC transporter ATP-binding protein [Planctomycetota bacterium]|jgi:ABC-2 type transport system ATP-binding protein|nr:ABC transporter ATP-binding protein [Planctomycetota bacterium]
MIEAIALNKYYGSRHAVKDVSFALTRGAITGFLGGNGAGKSTTMRMLTGFLTPSSGRVKIDGIDLAERPLDALKNLGYLPESNPLYRDMRVGEFLDYRARLKDIPRPRRQAAIDRAVAGCWQEERAEITRRIIGQLSKGNRQRVGLADCLLGDPPLLILDEPTVGLDPHQVRQTRALIQHLGAERTVFLSTHILHEVEMTCAEVIVVNRGAIVAQGKTRDLCQTSERAWRLQLSAPENPRAALEKLPNLSALEESRAGAAYFFRLRSPADLRGDLARLIAAKNWLVEEMTPEPAKLEDIFENLTADRPVTN